MIRRIISWSPILVGLILALTLGLLQSPAQAGGEKPTPSASIVPGASETGYWYQVKPGDSWRSVSQATGVPARELRKANPSKVRPNLWLYLGDRLWIPPRPVTPVPGQPTGPEI